VVEEVYLTAPDGPMVPDLQLSRGWSWIVAALGVGIVIVGAVVLSPSGHDQPAPTAATNWSQP
jgi:hypothetical protein